MKIKNVSKQKVYPIFQFLSFFAMLCFIVAFLFAVNADSVNDNGYKEHAGLVNDVNIKQVFGFSLTSVEGVFVSVALYVGIILEIFSYSCVIFIAKNRDRNFYDSLFLLFFMVPLLSNAITLAAQISKNQVFAEMEVDEEKIYDEVKLELNKHRLQELTSHSLIIEADKTTMVDNIKNAETEKQIIKSSSELAKISRVERRVQVEIVKAQQEAEKIQKKISKKLRKDKTK